MVIIMAENGSFLRGWLTHRGNAQVACHLVFPHKDNILNKFIHIHRSHRVGARGVFPDLER